MINVLSDFDVDAQKFIAACLADGGALTATQRNSVIYLSKRLKQLGLWDKLYTIYPVVGGTSITHKYNLKDPRNLDAAYRLTFFGSPTHSTNGIAWNGTTQYSDTFFRYSDNYNLKSMSYYSRTNATLNNEGSMGHFQTGGDGALLSIRRPSNIAVLTFGANNSIINNGVVTDSLGFFHGQRESLSSMSLYRNAGLLINNNVTPTNTNLISFNMLLGAWSIDGSPARFSNKECAFASFGQSLSTQEVTDFYNTVQQFQTILGRQV